MEADRSNLANLEEMMTKFVFEMGEINKHADKLEKAYRSAQKRYEEITKRSEALALEFEQAAKKNDVTLDEIRIHTDAVTTQVARMESSLKTIAAMDVFLKALDVQAATEYVANVLENYMDDFTVRLDKLVDKRVQEMLPKLASELRKYQQISNIPPVAQQPIQERPVLKSIIELYYEVGQFPFYVHREKPKRWTDDYYYRVDGFVNDKASGKNIRGGVEGDQVRDAYEKNYIMWQGPAPNDDDLPF